MRPFDHRPAEKENGRGLTRRFFDRAALMTRTTAMTAFVAILAFAHSMSAQLIGPFVGNN
jgi:hypothetical protein